MRYKANEADAVAALNTTFMKILDNVASKKPGIDFIPWAKRIAINQLIDEYRKTSRHRSIQTYIDPNELSYMSQQSAQNLALQDVNAEEIMRLIQRLPEPGRTIFNLHALEGFTHDEIAERLNMTAENSRYHLHSVRKLLRTQLTNKTLAQSKLA